MKKWKAIALLLSAAMLTTACGQTDDVQKSSESSTKQESSVSQEKEASSEVAKEEEREHVTLRIFMNDKATPDDEIVEEYINSLPQVQALNVTIDMVRPATAGEYNEKLPLQLASDEKMDIGFDAGSNFVNRVYQDAYYDISEFLEGDEFYDVIPEALWAGVTLNGGIYGVPTLKEIGEQWVFYAQTDVVKEAGLDPENITTLSLAEFEPILKVLKERDYAVLHAGKNQVKYLMKMGLIRKYDYVDDKCLAVVDREEGKTIVNGFETEEFVETIKLMYDWNQKGYIFEDALTRTNFSTGIYSNGEKRYGLNIQGYAPQGEVSMAGDPYYLDITVLPLTAPIVNNGTTQGSINAVYKKSENPERAYEFLKLWNTDPDVKNAFTYGVPGRHYVLIDGQVQYVENAKSMYTSQSWRTGNRLISYTLTSENKDKWDSYAEFNASAIPAVNNGFYVDTTSISAKLSTCNAVVDEYLTPLMLGFVEPEKGIAQLQEQLKAAGIDEVVAEIQKQYDAWLASK